MEAAQLYLTLVVVQSRLGDKSFEMILVGSLSEKVIRETAVLSQPGSSTQELQQY